MRGLLLPSLGVERDRLRRARVPARLQEPRRPRALGGPRPRQPRTHRDRFDRRARSPPACACRRCGVTALLRHVRMDGVRRRNSSAWLLPNDGTRTPHRLRHDMRRFADTDEVDLAIVGCGAGGATLLQRMARAGWSCVAFDAGPFWDPDRDWVSDEFGSHHLYWTDPRVLTGSDPVPLGSNNSGRGVGGSMIHYAGYTPRLHPSDFATWTNDGVGADWPISYADLRGYYESIEEELPVAGEDWPWGDPHGYPHSPHPMGGNGLALQKGCAQLGIPVRVGPVAIANGRFGNRPHCIYRGFCLQGCKVNAKASPLITHVPDALAHGAEVRADSMVSGIDLDREGRARGVVYFHNGV